MADRRLTAEDRLRAEYNALLHDTGLQERGDVADDPLLGAAARSFDRIAEDFRRTLRDAGIALPGAVLVGEYPHSALNAQARAARHGTLILVNTGFTTLVHEICKAHGLSVRMPSHEVFVKQLDFADSEADRHRNRTADGAVASVVLAYLLRGDARFGVRLPPDTGRSNRLAWALADATTRFVIAHEIAHLLEGHLDRPGQRAGSNRRFSTRDRELQADETGALLCLRALSDPGDDVLTYVTVAGPLIFLAIDHLVTRVRRELDGLPPGLRVSDYPSSDERGSRLRSLFQGIYRSSALQIADACVYWLSWREDGILAEADRLLRG
ncbi:hypothetical protein OHR68_07040 [Spirillospora sp. NBC_00431]